jgi:hypothetical protein
MHEKWLEELIDYNLDFNGENYIKADLATPVVIN